MTRTAPALPLTRSLRARLLPLLVLVIAVVSLSAPLAAYLLRRSQLRDQARAVGARAAALLQREARDHPRLWRYNTPKLVDHVQAYQRQTGVRRIVVTDEAGHPVSVGTPRTLRPLAHANLLWHQTPVRVAGRTVGAVWVAVEFEAAQRLFFRTMTKFALLALVLGILIYVIPLRTVAGAEAASERLRRELDASRERQDREQRLRTAGGRAVALQEAERRAIGRELHDGAGQALTAVRIHLQLMEQQAADPEALRALATKTVGLVDETLEEIRRAVRSLGPALVDEVGLRDAVARTCEGFEERTGVTAACELPESLDGLPTAVANACYRILQEALTNVARHAEASAVRVTLRNEAHRLRLAVVDDGHGFDADAPQAAGRGLSGMRERAELLGGTFQLESTAAQGTTLVVDLPTTDEAEDRADHGDRS